MDEQLQIFRCRMLWAFNGLCPNILQMLPSPSNISSSSVGLLTLHLNANLNYFLRIDIDNLIKIRPNSLYRPTLYKHSNFISHSERPPCLLTVVSACGNKLPLQSSSKIICQLKDSTHLKIWILQQLFIIALQKQTQHQTRLIPSVIRPKCKW